MALDIDFVRTHFPALAPERAFFDAPGGTQVPQHVVDRMADYLLRTNANHGGVFPTSVESDAIIEQARQGLAAFFNAPALSTIIFGPNMTSLTLSMSRALAKNLDPGDEIVVTRLDHDANISPWLLVAEDRGCTVRWIDFDVETCTLNLDDMQRAITPKTKVVAVGYASNAVGTINPVADITRAAHDVGALCYVDAVQYAPHGTIDVQALDCDFLVASAYKFYGPHIGVLYGKSEHLESLPAYKVRPAPEEPPGKFETGTQNHEGIAGTLGALEYIASLGAEGQSPGSLPPTRDDLVAGMKSISAHERALTTHLLGRLTAIQGVRVFGLTEVETLDQRVPTVSIRLDSIRPKAAATSLANRGIYVWNGNFYALAVTERLGVEAEGGLLRIGLAHYNTTEEVDRLVDAVADLARGKS